MLRLIMVVAIVVCGFSMLTSCSSDNDDTPNKKEYDGVPLVILDTDIGSSTDDLPPLSEAWHTGMVSSDAGENQKILEEKEMK